MEPPFTLHSLGRFFIASAAFIMACTLLTPIYLVGEGFVAGTLVATPHGYTPIDDLSVGDNVMSYNVETSALEHDVVSLVQQATIDSFVLITMGETLLAVAQDHRLYCPFEADEWVMACDITNQHQIATVPPEAVDVSDVTVVQHSVSAYSLSVRKNHNFFVSEQGILVHNMNPTAIKSGVEFLIAMAATATAVKMHEVQDKDSIRDPLLQQIQFQRRVLPEAAKPPVEDQPIQSSSKAPQVVHPTVPLTPRAVEVTPPYSIPQSGGEPLAPNKVAKNPSHSSSHIATKTQPANVFADAKTPAQQATQEKAKTVKETITPPKIPLKKEASSVQGPDQQPYTPESSMPHLSVSVNGQKATTSSTSPFTISLKIGRNKSQLAHDSRAARERRIEKYFIDNNPEVYSANWFDERVKASAIVDGCEADENYYFNNFEDYQYPQYIELLKTFQNYDKRIIALKNFLAQDAGATLTWPPSWFRKNPEHKRLDAILSPQNGFDFSDKGKKVVFSELVEKLAEEVSQQQTPAIEAAAKVSVTKHEDKIISTAPLETKSVEALNPDAQQTTVSSAPVAETAKTKRPAREDEAKRLTAKQLTVSLSPGTIQKETPVTTYPPQVKLVSEPVPFTGLIANTALHDIRYKEISQAGLPELTNHDLLRAGMFTAAADKQFGEFGGGLVNCAMHNPELVAVGVTIIPMVAEETGKAVRFAVDAATDATGWVRLKQASGYQWGPGGWYKPSWSTLYKPVFEEPAMEGLYHSFHTRKARQAAPRAAANETVQQQDPEDSQESDSESDDSDDEEPLSKKPRGEEKGQEEPRLSAAEFEKKISKMSPGERVAEVRKMAGRVAQERGLLRDKLSKNISKKNPNRDIYRKADSRGKTEELYSTDTQHGRFEVCDKNGKHLREVDFDLKQTKGPDLSGKHDLRVK